MSLKSLTTPFPWKRYSKKLTTKIDLLRHAGIFTASEAAERTLRLAVGQEGLLEEGSVVAIYWLVDPDDGIIVDARFQALGHTALLGAAEIACEWVVGKNYDQARRLSADLLEKEARDKSQETAFPKEALPHLNLILGAMDLAADQCTDIPLPGSYSAPLVPADIGEVLKDGLPGWQEWGIKQKLAVIEEVLDRDIRPYIALDGGGVTVLNLLGDREVVIAYQGNCTSCYSSIGTTLSYIQQVLRAKIHPELTVTPDLEFKA